MTEKERQRVLRKLETMDTDALERLRLDEFVGKTEREREIGLLAYEAWSSRVETEREEREEEQGRRFAGRVMPRDTPPGRA